MSRITRGVAVLAAVVAMANCAANEDQTASVTPADSTNPTAAVAPSGSAHDLFVDARRLEQDVSEALAAGTLEVAAGLATEIPARYQAALEAGSYSTPQRDSLASALVAVDMHARAVADEAHSKDLAGAKTHFAELQTAMRNAEAIAAEPGITP